MSKWVNSGSSSSGSGLTSSDSVQLLRISWVRVCQKNSGFPYTRHEPKPLYELTALVRNYKSKLISEETLLLIEYKISLIIILDIKIIVLIIYINKLIKYFYLIIITDINIYL